MHFRFLVTADVFAFAVLSSNPGQVFCHWTVSPALTSGYLNCPSWSTCKASCVPWLLSLAVVYISVVGAPLIFGEWGSSPPYPYKLLLPLHFLVVQETLQVSPFLVNPSPSPQVELILSSSCSHNIVNSNYNHKFGSILTFLYWYCSLSNTCIAFWFFFLDFLLLFLRVWVYVLWCVWECGWVCECEWVGVMWGGACRQVPEEVRIIRSPWNWGSRQSWATWMSVRENCNSSLQRLKRDWVRCQSALHRATSLRTTLSPHFLLQWKSLLKTLSLKLVLTVTKRDERVSYCLSILILMYFNPNLCIFILMPFIGEGTYRSRSGHTCRGHGGSRCVISNMWILADEARHQPWRHLPLPLRHLTCLPLAFLAPN